MTTFVEFLDRFQDSMAQAVVDNYPPQYGPEDREKYDLSALKRRPMGAQGDAIRAVAKSLRTRAGTGVVGEMGTGKTNIAISAAYAAGMKRMVVVCPPHLVHKWKREIEITLPNVFAVIVERVSDLQQVAARPDDGKTVWVIVSRERSKLSYQWEPSFVMLPWSKWETVGIGYRKVKKVKKGVHTEIRTTDEKGYMKREPGPIIMVPCCPQCHQMIVNERTGSPIDIDDLRKKRRTCQGKVKQADGSMRHCHGALWTASRNGPRRYPLADWIGKKMRGYFDLAILDEAHEAKAKGSAQGIAYATIASSARRILTLTGTVFGGYSSTLFYLLYRFSPEFRQEFSWSDEQRWIDRYGIRETVTKRSKGEDGGEARYWGKSSKRREYETTRERPGLSPAALFHLIGNTVFISLPDVASNLPPYTETIRMIPMEATQAAAYRVFRQEMYQALKEALVSGSKRLLGAYLQSLLGYPERCYEPMAVEDPTDGSVIAHAPGLGHNQTYPKEQALVDLVLDERKQGRKVWVYITHTHKGETPLGKRLKEKLGQAGIRVAVLDSSSVPPDKREAWIQKQVEAGVEVIVSHPKSVATGLDLIAFPTMVYYQTEYSVYAMRQSSRRSWRIGQERDVKIVFFVYEGTLQAEALSLVAAKMKASLLVEGNLADDGLAALNDDSGDIFVQLAKRLNSATKSDAGTLERLFADMKQAEQDSLGILARDWSPDDCEPVVRTKIVELDLVTEPAPPAVVKQVTFDEFIRLHPPAAVVPKRSGKNEPPPGQMGFTF